MPNNVENLDRIIRVLAGIALLCVVVFVPGNWRWVGLIGLVPLITGLVGWCPVYAMFSRD
jgi:cadmium resistance protein CadD (predicted permease)